MRELAIVLLLSCGVAWADDQTRRLVTRVSEEAAALARLAPNVIGRETLEQQVLKPPPRFRIRVGESAKENIQEFEQRTLVSEYTFTTYADGSIHEVHQVISKDGKPVKNSGPEALMKLVLADRDDRKRELLGQFSGHGLRGAVTDFGQLLLLFAPANIVRYEFVLRRTAHVSGVPALVFSYHQIDGPNALTVIEKSKGEAQDLPADGEIWVREADFLPIRMTLSSGVTRDGITIRQEAQVDYAMSPFGAVLPQRTLHRELQDGRLMAENAFSYSGFQRFGATAEIIFDGAEADPAEPDPEDKRE